MSYPLFQDAPPAPWDYEQPISGTLGPPTPISVTPTPAVPGPVNPNYPPVLRPPTPPPTSLLPPPNYKTPSSLIPNASLPNYNNVVTVPKPPLLSNKYWYAPLVYGGVLHV